MISQALTKYIAKEQSTTTYLSAIFQSERADEPNQQQNVYQQKDISINLILIIYSYLNKNKPWIYQLFLPYSQYFDIHIQDNKIFYLMSQHKNLFAKNPWHYVSYGKETPKYVNAIIQIPADSKAKYELDKESGLLKLDRVLFSAVHYPQNYGFIPQTYCDDKDPLDILVICSVRIEPLCLVQAKVIGVMNMLDQGQGDDKIIAVARHDKSVSHMNDISQLPEHLLEQIQRFFQDYKKMQKKEVKISGFLGHEKAYEVVNESIELYKKTYGSE